MADVSKVLAFDSAGAACSAALYRDGRIVSRRFAAMTRGHSEALVPMLPLPVKLDRIHSP